MRIHSITRTLMVGFLAATWLLLSSDVEAASGATPLRVGVTPTTPPMVFKEGKRLVGLEIEFANALGADLGRPVQFVELKWEDQIDALLDDRIEIIMSSMSITRPRQFRIAFSDPYLRVGQMALVRAQDVNQFAFGIPQPLPGVVGVLKATTGDYLVQQEFFRSKRKVYTAGEEAAMDLRKKRIDIFIADSSLIWWLAAANESKGLAAVPMVLTEEDLAWGMRRSDAELQKAANVFLRKSREDGRFSEIVKRWLPNAR